MVTFHHPPPQKTQGLQGAMMRPSETIYIDSDEQGNIPIAETCQALDRVQNGTAELHMTLSIGTNALRLLDQVHKDFPRVYCKYRVEERGPLKEPFHVISFSKQ
jgi:hypothetical protein